MLASLIDNDHHFHAMLTEHLLELRHRLLKVLYFYIGLCCVCFFYANTLLHFMLTPLSHVLKNNQTLIATKIASPLLTPLQLAANIALLFTIPFAIYQGWRFISPALYRQERHTVISLMSLSFILFVLGVLFCFYLVLPWMMNYFSYTLPSDVQWMPDISDAAHFVTHMLLIFGLCFQVPLVCVLLVLLGFIRVSTLKAARPYVIVGAFIIGMLLTPPDVVSQIILAIPLCLLYEIGIFLALRLNQYAKTTTTLSPFK